MKKRGISAIVATVLIILLTVAAVGILWAAIIPMIQNNLDFSSLEGRVSVLTSNGYTYYDAVEQKASVQVKRDVDEGVMDRILIVMDFNGSSVSSLVVAPNSGSTKVYVFDVSGYGEPDSVSVAPVFVASSGREKEGELTSEGFFGVGDVDVSSLKSPVYVIGREYEGEIPLDGLISWWKLDGDGVDTMGGHDGVVNGGDWVEGVSGQAFDNFDESNSNYIEIAAEGELVNITDDGSSFSLSCWYNTRGIPDYRPGYIFFRAGYHEGLYHDTTDALATMLWSSTNAPAGLSFPNPNYDSWYHLVMIVDEENNQTKFYVNGVLEGEWTYSIALREYDTSSWYIGGHSGDYNPNGMVDEAMIYDRALSDEEVAIIYEVQSP